MADCSVTRVTNCTICLGTYKEPRVLPCGHTFCLDCIKEHGRNKGSDPDCPNCRTQFQIPSNGFEALPKNYCLSSVLNESFSAVDMSKATVIKRHCEKHSGEELVLYCLQCNDVICLDCLQDDHQKHDCSKISVFAKSARTQLDGYVKSIKPILSQVTSQKSKAEEESSKFRDQLVKSQLAINEECDNVLQLVNSHRILLLEELSNEKQRVEKNCKMRIDEIETEWLRIASFITRIEEMLQGTDEATTLDLVQQYKHFKDCFDKLDETHPPAKGHVSIEGIKFIPGDLKDLIRKKGNAVGRLQKECDSATRRAETSRRSSVLQKDFTPSNKQVDLSLSQRFPIDLHACCYLECEHPNEEVFGFTTCTLNSLDQCEMEEQMAALEHDDVDVILNDDKTFRLEGNYVNVEKAIEQLKELRKKVVGRNTSEENKEQISNNCDPVKPKVERNWLLRKHLAPSNKQLDLSLSQMVPIDPHVWYYLERKHPNEVDIIVKKHMCISRVVYESSNEEITRYLEVAPYALDDADEASKHVDDAVEEFAQFYQTVSKLEIVKESIKLPLAFDKGMPEHLIRVVEEMGVFFLRSDDPYLVGPKACVEEAKRKVTDLFREKNDSPAQRQPNNNFGSSPASAANQTHPLNFVTPNGLKVYVSKGDLVRQTLDAIVNPANERLGHGGGAARAIANAAGHVLEKESKEFIWKHGKLGIAHVMHTSAGNLRPKIKYVIHTVGPRKSDVKDEQELLDLIRCTVLNTLLYANDELKIHSVAIPAISSGIFGVPIEIVGRASFEALIAFDNYCGSRSRKSLHEIHFLNKDEATFFHMKRTFEHLMKDNYQSNFV